MDRDYLERLNPARLPSPCFVVDESLIARNLTVLESIIARTGVRVLLALKGFAMFSLFPQMRPPLHGTCASGVHEARLGREHFGGEVHVFSPAYSPAEITALGDLADVVVFNSLAQYQRFGRTLQTAARPIALGLRVNPEHSEGSVAIYNPCAPGSRLGIRQAQFDGATLEGISGLHFHTLCEQNADALARTLDAVEEKFGRYLHAMQWLNMGGGHHITRADYDIELLCHCIERVQQRYQVQVYLEPGEAIALNSGLLLTTVLDLVTADMPVAILDMSAACHTPDVLEMPYRPNVIGAGLPGQKAWTCRLAGKSCLAGDVVGEYSFDTPLQVGDRLAFLDMAIYSMVKTTTFNGVGLPAITRYHPPTDALTVVRQFGYEDYKCRLS